jgi:LisH
MDTSTPLTDQENELLAAVREALDRNNSLNQLKAAIRAKVLRIVQAGVVNKEMEKSTRLQHFNSLIFDYLKWFGYHYSAEVFQTEAKISTNATSKFAVPANGSNDLPVLLQLFLQQTADNTCTSCDSYE